jgi:hypothetical protein
VRQPDELNDKRMGYDSGRQLYIMSEVHTFHPELISSFRFGTCLVRTIRYLAVPVSLLKLLKVLTREEV